MLLLPIQKEMRRRLAVLLAALTVTVALSVYWEKSQLLAQTGCQDPPPNPNHGGWRQGSTVTYQIPSDATADQTSQINQAFQSWTSSDASGYANVTFANLGSNSGPPQLNIILCFTPGCAPGGYPAFTAVNPPNATPITSATMYIDVTQVPTSNSDFDKAALHEIGHTMGLADLGQSGQPNCGEVAGGSVMNTLCTGLMDPFSNMPTSVTNCDQNGVDQLPQYPAPSGGTGGCSGFKNFGSKPSLQLVVSCGGGGPGSPIIIDVSGNGFYLTSAQNGVAFDITGGGHPVQIAWTAPGAQNAFLCLPDPNGACDDGKDLFGNFTPQPPSSTPNGFAALAVYDDPKNGGNGDGVIDARDAIFSSLRLWIDANHDGISQPSELYTLPALGVESISLDYHAAMKKDKYGNVFRYRASVDYDDPSIGSRVAYDVFLVTSPALPSTVTASNHTRSGAVLRHGM